MSQFTVTAINLAKDQTKPTKAFADVKAAGLVHKGIRVVQGNEGVFVSMPSKKRTTADGKPVMEPNPKTGKMEQVYDDHFFPESKEVRNQLESAVLSAYSAKVESLRAEAATNQK